MTIALPRERLAAVLGLLGSQHDGEVLAAARQAERIRQQAGTTWQDIVMPRAEPRQGQPLDWREAVALCRARAERLTAWEVQFINSLVGYRQLSARQREVLDRLVGKVRQ